MAVAALAAEEKRLIRCPGCGTILAAEVAGLSIVTHRGREWVGVVLSMRCQCGATWRPDAALMRRMLDRAEVE